MHTCATCRYWHRSDATQGECRRYPPTAMIAGIAQTPLGPKPGFTAAFPTIRADLNCGEHKIKIELTQ